MSLLRILTQHTEIKYMIFFGIILTDMRIVMVDVKLSYPVLLSISYVFLMSFSQTKNCFERLIIVISYNYRITF